MLPGEVRMEEPEQTYMGDPPRTQQMDKEEQNDEADLSSHWSCCDTCGFCYSERQSESHVEETNTGNPNSLAQGEEDDVWMLHDMFENLLHET
jgi:hypothetical protein